MSPFSLKLFLPFSMVLLPNPPRLCIVAHFSPLISWIQMSILKFIALIESFFYFNEVECRPLSLQTFIWILSSKCIYNKESGRVGGRGDSSRKRFVRIASLAHLRERFSDESGFEPTPEGYTTASLQRSANWAKEAIRIPIDVLLYLVFISK